MQKFENGLKICSTCRETKQISEFGKDRSKSDGLMNQCKVCKRKYRTSEYYHKRESELEKTPDWRFRKSKYAHTPNGMREGSKLSYCKCGNILNTKNLLTYEQLEIILAGQGYKCAICNLKFSVDIKYTNDCITPISKGGNLTFENTQVLCIHCNAIKHTKIYSGLGNRWRSQISQII